MGINSQVGLERNIIQLLGNERQAEAHTWLYQTANMWSSNDYIIAKIDSDMIVKPVRLFAAVARLFAENKKIDRLTILVDDHLTGKKIEGLHFFRPGTEFGVRTDDLRTDSVKSNVKKIYVYKPHTEYVSHGEQMSDTQAERWVSHRFLKALSEGPRSSKWTLLDDLISISRSNPTQTRLFAVGILGLLTLDSEYRNSRIRCPHPTVASDRDIVVGYADRLHGLANSGSTLLSVLTHEESPNEIELADRLQEGRLYELHLLRRAKQKIRHRGALIRRSPEIDRLLDSCAE